MIPFIWWAHVSTCVNLETQKLGNLETRKHGNLELGSLETRKLGSLETRKLWSRELNWTQYIFTIKIINSKTKAFQYNLKMIFDNIKSWKFEAHAKTVKKSHRWSTLHLGNSETQKWENRQKLGSPFSAIVGFDKCCGLCTSSYSRKTNAPCNIGESYRYGIGNPYRAAIASLVVRCARAVLFT